MWGCRMDLIIIRDKKGFTLVELVVAIGILAVLTATSLPLVTAYRVKAELLDLKLTVKHLKDGLEFCYLENDEFYPEVSGTWLQDGERTVERGEGAEIKEILYTFPPGHKHEYVFKRMKFDIGDDQYDLAWINIHADNDYDRDGMNDEYTVKMYMKNGRPWEGKYRWDDLPY